MEALEAIEAGCKAVEKFPLETLSRTDGQALLARLDKVDQKLVALQRNLRGRLITVATGSPGVGVDRRTHKRGRIEKRSWPRVPSWRRPMRRPPRCRMTRSRHVAGPRSRCGAGDHRRRAADADARLHPPRKPCSSLSADLRQAHPRTAVPRTHQAPCLAGPADRVAWARLSRWCIGLTCCPYHPAIGNWSEVHVDATTPKGRRTCRRLGRGTMRGVP